MPVKVGLRYIAEWRDSMEDAVLEYEREPIIEGQIVFYGPSNFTRWSTKWGHTPLREVLLGKSGNPCAINRGFGSSCAEHQLYYYSRMVRPLAPKVLVYSCFGNYSAFGYTVEENWELAERVIAYALTDFPDIHIYLCGPQRHKADSEASIARALKCTELGKKYAENTEGCYYLDVYNHQALNRQDIYVADGVHYNQLGYDIYADFFRAALKDELDRF